MEKIFLRALVFCVALICLDESLPFPSFRLTKRELSYTQ